MPPRREARMPTTQAELQGIIAAAIPQYAASQGETSGNISNNNNNNPPNGCTFKQFLDCKPQNFDGTGGAVAFTRWTEKTETTIRMSKCAPGQQVTYITGLFTDGALSWWNLQVQTLGEAAAYAMTWVELKELMRKKCFSGHVITVLTNYHLGQILSKPDVVGRLAKWAIELGGHNILYKPRPAIKGQVLADFVIEVLVDKIQECKTMQDPIPIFDDRVWILHTDGASNDDGAGAGLRLVSPDNHELTYTIRLDFKSTNNEVEYEAFLVGLHLAIKMGAKNLEVHVDSLLVAGQVSGHYDAKGETMALYLEQAKTLIDKFQTFKVTHVN
ncbi:uncharacterized protein LOC110943072 [Helianthus annuus]|uniref:uncharacterized protein LOC110943072 n=1 Tax=Helianthus annuus TaxID=4232 RepID=UPI000B8F673C|nr:uncharacterized protein LOC110943072 [Helianthus annuus]